MYPGIAVSCPAVGAQPAVVPAAPPRHFVGVVVEVCPSRGLLPSWPRNRDMPSEKMSALVVANSAEKRRAFDYRRFCTGCASTVLSMRSGRVEREMGGFGSD